MHAVEMLLSSKPNKSPFTLKLSVKFMKNANCLLIDNNIQ